MKRKKVLAGVLGALCAVMALAFALYPLISNYFASRNKSLVCTEYSDTIEEFDRSELDEMRQAARAYNARLAPVSVAVEESFSQAGLLAAAEDYDELLAVNASGMMGYIEIPKIGVYLPIYHGTSEAVLQAGVGHLLGSSLPVGGEGSHTVLTAHSGLARETMFSDLDQLTPGDIFYLHILDETLSYEVTELFTVLPEDASRLTVCKGEDLCTLVTCTPFGVNTHRLLVRGSRTEYSPDIVNADAEEATTESAPSTWAQEYCKGLALTLALFAIGGTSVFLCRRRKRGKHESS